MSAKYAADGVRIVRDGAEPAAGGIKGAPALREDGAKGCVKCGITLVNRGRSPYCAPCKADAVRAAARKRDQRQVDAHAARQAILSAEHWRGDGFLYGRDGSLYLDAATVNGLRATYGSLLSSLTEYKPDAEAAVNPRRAQRYHDGLAEILDQVEVLNMVLRGPLWPRSSGYQPPVGGER